MKEKSCSVKGCSNVHEAKGWCAKHYMRFKRHGHILFTREHDWGARERHPLYKTWSWLIRRYTASNELCQDWLDLWKFVECVKEKPIGYYRFTRRDDTKPFSPDNWYWREFTPKSEEERENHRIYANRWRREKSQSDPDFEFKRSLKRHYGITINQYFEMHEKQNGVCAICEQPETSVDKNSKKVRKLAVDHCHTTGKIRGLLCGSCNKAIGAFKDSTKLLNKAINYLGG